jgi:hypothetical protein
MDGGEGSMRGTVMLEAGLVEVAVYGIDGINALVRDDEGNGFWVELSGIEWEV